MYAPATGQAKPVEEEVITEENVYERPDEPSVFPNQCLRPSFRRYPSVLRGALISRPRPLSDPA